MTTVALPQPPGPHRLCVPGNAPIPGFAVCGNLPQHNKSYNVAPIADHREVYDQNRDDAAFRCNRDSPLCLLPGPNPQRLFPAIGVAVDPPDGSGTKSLPSHLSRLEIESKNPRGANSPGV